MFESEFLTSSPESKDSYQPTDFASRELVCDVPHPARIPEQALLI